MTIQAKFHGKCSICGERIYPGDSIEWDKKTKETQHTACADEGEPVVASKTSATGGFTPTTEQEVALELARTGRSFAIEAGAGSGKTSTLRLVAEVLSDKTIQYVAFNKKIVAEAGSKMPANVSCSTAHALAFKAVGRKYSDRLRNSARMRSEQIAAYLDIRPIKLGKDKTLFASHLAGVVMSGVTRFCQSADTEPAAKHVPYLDGIDEIVDGQKTYTNNDHVAKLLVPAMRRAWADLNSDTGRLPFRHDHYLKMWQLSDPKIGADVILFDEAQDANPVMLAIVQAQTHAQIVWVGDSQQQIYTFTGAINALAKVEATDRAFLTQSFRFGPAVADVANIILGRLNAELRLVGTATIPSKVEPILEPDAILTRTNASAVRAVLTAQRAGQRPALVGGGAEVVRFARAAQDLMEGRRTDHPELACFESWGEVTTYVDEDQQGGELRLMVKLVEDFGVPTIVAALQNEIPESLADVVISTAHKAKGCEWNHVQIAGDFPTDVEGGLGPDELRLLYVACTRAKLTLDHTAVQTLNPR